MTHWIDRPQPGPDSDDWATTITKVAIEKSVDLPRAPWSLWGRDYETGLPTEEIWEYETFEEAVAAIPAFFAMYAPRKA